MCSFYPLIVRQSAKVVFEKVLQLHCIFRNENHTKEDKGLAGDHFLQSLVRHLFTVSWSSRGKFSALTSCVKHLGCQPLLDIQPGLPVEVIQQLQEQALSCYASELYCNMFTSHMEESGCSESSFKDIKLPDHAIAEDQGNLKSSEKTDTGQQLSKAKLFETWAEPVTKAMCTHKKKLKQNIVEYLLPRLLKSGDGILNYMIQGLSARLKDMPQQAQGAITMCLHRARTLGFLKTSVVGTEKGTSLWLGYLSTDVLKETLCSMDDHIRLDAFALVCENSKTSEVVTTFEFEMLKFFIPHNVNNQSPAFRQSFLALLKKLIFRVKESLLSLQRKSKGKNIVEPVTNAINDYESFCEWLAIWTVENLYPGAAFARRTTSLAILSLLTASFTSEKDGFCVPVLFKKAHIQALLGALTDTFEENKREAFSVLTCFIQHQEPIWDTEGTVETLSLALSLACSTRPQDCATAVYIFLVLLKQQEFYPNQSHFAALLSSATGALEVKDGAVSNCPKLLLLWSLLHLLNSQIAVAEESLVSAAANRPMYPTLHCIRYILQEIDFGTMKGNHMPSAKDFIKRLIISCLHLSRVVSPVVQNSSPEGNIPEEAVTGLDTPNAEWSRALVESMPEYLVVCGWRSIKEVSLTLGSLCLQLPTSLIMKEETSEGLLTLDQIEIIGKYFNQQLLESIHRGAFELAYAGFQLTCQTLWRHPLSCFHQLPSLWLSAVLQDIKSGDPQSKLCATRRSAGVPFLVQAITSTEPNLTGRQMFHRAMKELLQLALNQDREACQAEIHSAMPSTSDAQVHALNILRALYRESRLGDDVVLYVADGLKAAILGFRSEQWAVRNSATLLLSSLMTRIFGVKRSKDETAMSKKNCQTGRAFFYRYPTLYPFLLEELEAATANVMSRDRLSLHPSLYPVLLVLGRLFPSTLEGSDTSLSLSAFIPYIIRCASSPVYKTRVIASRAIQPLAKRNEVVGISLSLWENLPLSPSSQSQSSHVHGSLLQLTQLIKLVEDFHDTNKLEALKSFVDNLSKRNWIFKKLNPCFATRQAACILTDAVLDVASTCHVDSQKATFISDLKTAFRSSISDHEAQNLNSFLPFYFEFEKTRAELCLKHLVAAEISSFDQSISALKNGCQKSKQHNQPDAKQLEVPASTYQSNCEKSNLDKKFGEENLDVDHSNNQVLLLLLNSPVYDVRLGVLDVLLSSLSSRASDSQIDLTNTSGCSHAFPGNEDLDSELFSHAHSGKVTIQGAEAVVSRLYHQLLKMAIDIETHHLCQEKVFYLLASLPEGFSVLEKEKSSYLLQMLSSLTERIQAERRTEVKAAILRFTVSLVAILYKRIQELNSNSSGHISGQAETNLSTVSNNQVEVSSVLIKWLKLLRDSSSADENPVLQISCCHCLLQNADILLVDPQGIFGPEVYTVWNTLVVLLQDDDLEVKEIAASVVCALLKKEKGLSNMAMYCSKTKLRPPMRSILEECKCGKARLVTMLEDSDDPVVKTVQPFIKTIRKWKVAEAIDEAKEGLKVK
ncbi:thyroid adenoma-associated-like protein [Elysia marginata]|uniref:tRNA (32-2'-O)-methyltransferase regulator THADA n=1 Tax=Elysia marginata TaxID=1093978 RepID=A0AAV4F3R4_9GAST|nr:thyroid adenoma-associated-like protein [Elysia marginata]